MQDPIAELKCVAAVYAQAVEAAARRRVERDAVIAAAFTEGVPIRVIASTVGLTASRVSDILGRPMGQPGRPRGRSARLSEPNEVMTSTPRNSAPTAPRQ